jgi:hypothetical protein
MINRMVHEAGVPATAQLAEVARMNMALRLAQAEEQARSPDPAPLADIVANGAEVDRLV